MQLPSLRERSHETSDDANHQHDPTDAVNLTSKGLDYLPHLSRGNPTIKPAVADEDGADGLYKGQCHSPGVGNLTLDMIPGPENSTHEQAGPVSSCSSNYSATPSLEDDKSEAPTVEPSPSPYDINSLHLSDLEKYSRANNCLSNLRSISDSSGGESCDGTNASLGDTEQHIPNAATKRRASHFSLRSLSNSFATKRRRLSVRKFATAIHRQFVDMSRRLRRRTTADRRCFEA
ncbi:hypothetical protein ACO1O0_006284 [Amphichorda felina]